MVHPRNGPCKRAKLDPTQERAFTNEWNVRRAAARGDPQKPDWSDAGARKPDLRNANLPEAFLSGADFSGAQMQGANLVREQMEEANHGYSRLTGSANRPILLRYTNLNARTNHAGALRFVDFTDAIFDARTDFRNAFLDGSVTLPDAFRAQLGDQCQSRFETVLTDQAFYGRWRGWVEASDELWRFNPPDEWRDVTAIPPDPLAAYGRRTPSCRRMHRTRPIRREIDLSLRHPRKRALRNARPETLHIAGDRNV